MRELGTTASGEPFSDDIVEAVWQKGLSVWGMETFKKDMYGASICRFKYGKQEKKGWVIYHVLPVANGGTDDVSNLQPLYWENNIRKGDKILKAGDGDNCFSVVTE